MNSGSAKSRPPIDVLIVAAVKDEWAAVVGVHTGAVPDSEWTPLDDSKPEVHTRLFQTTRGNLHVAVVQAFGMGGPQAAIAAAPLLERYKGDRPVKCTRMKSLTAIADLDEARTSLDAQ